MRTRFQSQPLFFLFLFPFFSLFLLLTTSLRHQFFYFLSDVASSPLVYFKEMRFSLVFFDFEAHTHSKQKIKKSVFRLGRPEIGFRNFELPPQGRRHQKFSLLRTNERTNERTEDRENGEDDNIIIQASSSLSLSFSSFAAPW